MDMDMDIDGENEEKGNDIAENVDEALGQA